MRHIFGTFRQTLRHPKGRYKRLGVKPLATCIRAKMNSAEAADVAIFVLCVSLFVLYNGLYYFSGSLSRHTPDIFHVYKSAGLLWSTGKKARSVWADRVMNSSSESILAIHTFRNLLISVAWFAAADSALIVHTLNVLTSPSSIAQIEEYEATDPITHGDSFISVPVKISLALAVLFMSLLLFVQSARMAVHLGFLVKVVPENANRKIPFREGMYVGRSLARPEAHSHAPTLAVTVVLIQRMNFQFSVGVRMLFAFVPLTFYAMLGTLALLISTLVLLVLMFFLDVVPSSSPAVDWLMRTHQESVEEASICAEGGSDVSFRSKPDTR